MAQAEGVQSEIYNQKSKIGLRMSHILNRLHRGGVTLPHDI